MKDCRYTILANKRIGYEDSYGMTEGWLKLEREWNTKEEKILTRIVESKFNVLKHRRV